MLGLRALFAALTRLAAAVNRSADLFDAANEQLAERIGVDRETPALEHTEEPAKGRGKR